MAREKIGQRASTFYGVRQAEQQAASCHHVSQGFEKQVIPFSYDSLPINSLDKLYQAIPAGARITAATLTVVEAFVGGTSYDIGLYEEDGTLIDADGIDAAVAVAALANVGDRVDCDGALVGADAQLAAAGQVVIAATGTFTAGRAVLTVEYERLEDRARDSVFDA